MKFPKSAIALSTLAIWLGCVLGLITQLHAQPSEVNALERLVTLEFRETPVAQALVQLGKSGGVTFSYQSSVLPVEPFTGSFNQVTMREALEELLRGQVDYKVRGKYIILTKRPVEVQVIQGYIVDDATGKRLKNVSVYDPGSLRSSITDESGFFRIQVINPSGEELRLAIVKKDYTDTTIRIARNNRRFISVPLQTGGRRMMILNDSLGRNLKSWFNEIWSKTEQMVNMENINDTLYKDWQVSFLPFIGSNGKLSGNVVNRFSLNFLAGYSLGNTGLEFGGLANLQRGDVSGVQIAGLFNGALGNTESIQLAGLANLTRGDQRGIQLAGLANFSYRNSSGIKLAGLSNVTLGNSEDLQLAGLLNGTLGTSQLALAGLVNFSNRDVHKGQISGLLNFSGGNTTGAQVAGLLNYTHKTTKGLQLSGLLNVTRNLEGTSIALFNLVRDSCKGLPIGLLSYVRRGYHTLELSADESFMNQLALRSGVRQFYTILFAGARPQSYNQDSTTWTFGYGLGTAPRLAKKLFLNLDLTTQQVVQGNNVQHLDLITRFLTALEWKPGKNIAFFAGATLNLRVKERNQPSPEVFSFYTPAVHRLSTGIGPNDVDLWLGGKAGIRIF